MSPKPFFLYLFLVLFQSIIVRSGEEANASPFEVRVSVLSPTKVRLSWTDANFEEDGVQASQFRVLCTTEGHERAIEAMTSRKDVEIDTFIPEKEYTCEVHAVWNKLVDGVEVISASPGISKHFLMPDRQDETNLVDLPSVNLQGEIGHGRNNLSEKTQHEDDELRRENKTAEGTAIRLNANDKVESPTGPSPIGDSVETDHIHRVEEQRAIPQVFGQPDVKVEVFDETNVLLSWQPVKEKHVEASRYRIVCHATHDNTEPAKVASTQQTLLEWDNLDPHTEYTCSVTAVWDYLIPGVEIVSLRPGITQPFKIFNCVGVQMSWIVAFTSAAIFMSFI